MFLLVLQGEMLVPKQCLQENRRMIEDRRLLGVQ
jgi:hypothetical protein